MPCFQWGNRDLTDEYVSAIDSLQTVVGDYGTLAHIIIMNDLNVKIPLARKFQGTSAMNQGFNANSKIMYDFVVGNDLNMGDFTYPQSSNYTYLQHTLGIYTKIDHILISSYNKSINSCLITPKHPDNLSDHLLISIYVSIIL